MDPIAKLNSMVGFACLFTISLMMFVITVNNLPKDSPTYRICENATNISSSCLKSAQETYCTYLAKCSKMYKNTSKARHAIEKREVVGLDFRTPRDVEFGNFAGFRVNENESGPKFSVTNRNDVIIDEMMADSSAVNVKPLINTKMHSSRIKNQASNEFLTRVINTEETDIKDKKPSGVIKNQDYNEYLNREINNEETVVAVKKPSGIIKNQDYNEFLTREIINQEIDIEVKKSSGRIKNQHLKEDIGVGAINNEGTDIKHRNMQKKIHTY